MVVNQSIGFQIRGTIGKGPKCPGPAYTYRVRRGAGGFYSTEGELYQDKYLYTAAMAAIDTGTPPTKANLAAAVDYWKTILSESEKEEYNRRAVRAMHMSGYNLFLREALKGVVHMWVDRGDVSSLDFEIADFTKDNAWHDLDLTAIIPTTARLILMDFDYNNTSNERHIEIRKQGQTYNFNHTEIHTRVAAQADHAMMVVSCGINRIIEYKMAAVGWTELAMTVRGWWT